MGNFYYLVFSGISSIEELCMPCGGCRQFLLEFGDMKIISFSEKETKEFKLSELLPKSFNKSDIK